MMVKSFYDDDFGREVSSSATPKMEDKKKQSTVARKVIKDFTWEFADVTSIGGLGNAYHARPPLLKILWLLVLAVGTYFTIHDVYFLYLTYISYPYTSQVNVVNEVSLQVPGMTVCNQNRISCAKVLNASLDRYLVSPDTYAKFFGIYLLTKCGIEGMGCKKAMMIYYQYRSKGTPPDAQNGDDCFRCSKIFESYQLACNDMQIDTPGETDNDFLVYIRNTWFRSNCLVQYPETAAMNKTYCKNINYGSPGFKASAMQESRASIKIREKRGLIGGVVQVVNNLLSSNTSSSSTVAPTNGTTNAAGATTAATTVPLIAVPTVVTTAAATVALIATPTIVTAAATTAPLIAVPTVATSSLPTVGGATLPTVPPVSITTSSAASGGGLIGAIVNAVSNTTNSTLTGLTGTVSNITNGVIGTVTNATNSTIVGVINTAINATNSTLSGVAGAVNNVTNSTLTGVIGAVTNATNSTLTGVIGAVTNATNSTLTGLIGTVTNLTNSTLNGVIGAVTNITSTLSGVVSYVGNTVILPLLMILPTFQPITDIWSATTNNSVTFEDGRLPSKSYNLEVQYLMAYMNLSVEERKLLGYTVDELIVDCNFMTLKCDMKKDFVPSFSATYGNCYTFTRNRQTSLTGDLYGLSMILDVHQDTYLPQLLTAKAGARLSVHPLEVRPPVEDNGIDLPVNVDSSVGVTKRYFERLPAPFDANCFTNWNDSDYAPNDDEASNIYTTAECLRMCLQQLLITDCGCHHPLYPEDFYYQQTRYVNYPICNLPVGSDDYMCINNALLTFANDSTGSACNCNVECEENQYSLAMSQANWPPNVSQKRVANKYNTTTDSGDLLAVNVYFSSLIVDQVIQQPVYQTATDVLASLGGALGLYLGFSLVAVGEILEYITMVSWYLILSCFGKLKDPEEEKEDEEKKLEPKTQKNDVFISRVSGIPPSFRAKSF